VGPRAGLAGRKISSPPEARVYSPSYLYCLCPKLVKQFIQRVTVFHENPQDMYILVQCVVKLFVQCAVPCCRPRVGLDRRGKSRLHRDSIPGPSSPYPVAMQTTIPDPHLRYQTHNYATRPTTTLPDPQLRYQTHNYATRPTTTLPDPRLRYQTHDYATRPTTTLPDSQLRYQTHNSLA